MDILVTIRQSLPNNNSLLPIFQAILTLSFSLMIIVEADLIIEVVRRQQCWDVMLITNTYVLSIRPAVSLEHLFNMLICCHKFSMSPIKNKPLLTFSPMVLFQMASFHFFLPSAGNHKNHQRHTELPSPEPRK